ncbi:MAG: hypothetical protein HYU66_29445, partial [Armatimonadetes bacterium]|nr:hypothetical protein [Armatimonadota bacterium]
MHRLVPAVLLLTVGLGAAEPRRVVSLDGTWQIAEGRLDTLPAAWPATVPVPGLADMAKPAFAEVGTSASRGHREAYYYRRTFTLPEPLPAVARLKIHKACFGTRVWLNGQLLGDHRGSFTPGWFDARPALRRDNELIVRVGADRAANGRDVPDGSDFEKVRFLPGVYDHVELILSDSPYVVRMQVVPQPVEGTVRVVAWLRTAAGEARCRPAVSIREARSGEFAGDATGPEVSVGSDGERMVEVLVHLRRPRLWSPEDPFLYTARVDIGTDVASTRFGLRSFRFDRRAGKAVLNGRFYYLRGPNVCIHRYCEDPVRGDKPWRREWVGWLHQAFRSMHWNAMRYCIGFPPEDWYDVADETGLLIQDEYPLWWGDRWPAELKHEALERDYTEWLQERWNHPSVVIWDAQNETVCTETGAAIRAVRGQDLSDRPWDNGWSPPDRPTDVYEAHPYAYINPAFSLDSFARMTGRAGQPGELGGNVIPNSGNNPV